MNDIKLIIDGKEYICRPVEEKTVAAVSERARTGYEKRSEFYAVDIIGGVVSGKGLTSYFIDTYYDAGNGYNDEQLAIDIARADNLIRCMRQWQAVNDEAVEWGNLDNKYCLYYAYDLSAIRVVDARSYRYFGQIYFSSREKAEAAVNIFHDELIWYFTEYRQRLDEPRKEE